MKTTLLFLLTICCAIPALAKESNYGAQYNSCMDKSGGVTASMKDCIGNEIKVQDDRLNATYKKLMAAEDADYKQVLKKAQQLWIPYRDANCQVYSQSAAGGTLAGVLYGNCILEMTHSRAKELQGLLTDATENK